ncbi:MAG: two-component regulator propeller domain-containing protein [Gilvibacter sp.]
MRLLFTAVLLWLCQPILGQSFEDSWVGYFSYNNIVDLSEGPDEIYAGAQNAFFEYDLTTEELTTTSSIQGLSGEDISTIYYSEAFGLTLLGYDNGLIEVVGDDGSILTVVDILDKPTIPPDEKRINHFFEFEDQVYISSDFGISEFDLALLEFGDTFFIGPAGTRLRITQLTVHEGFIYATSADGLKQAVQANDNLIDFEQWSTVIGAASRGVVSFGGNLYVARFGGNISVFDGTSSTTLETLAADGGILDLRANGQYLVATTGSEIHIYDADFVKVALIDAIDGFELDFRVATARENVAYIGTRNYGVLAVPFGTAMATQILPDGPLKNSSFAIDAAPGQLWTVFGDITVSFNPFPLSRFGVSHLVNDAWANYTYEEVFEANDLVNVTINPADTSQVYMSSYNRGLLSINAGTPTTLLNDSNSALESSVADASDVRIYGSDFDREGNLWFVQSRVNDGLKRLSGTSITSVNLDPVLPDGDLALTELKISREGFVFFGTAQNGVIGYNPSSGALNRMAEGVGSGNLPFNDVRALSFDNNNRLWIGTTQGLRVYFNVGGFFEDGANIDSNQIIILEDGVPQELLFDQPITDIKTDGSNNKWVATATSGVFYFSANGQETLLRFTKENSPLPSNNVQDIAIDSQSGRVYFATVNGLVAFNGTATAPRDNLEGLYAFPNPVRPEYSGPVTIDGLTADANVKITDLEGNLVYEEQSEGGSIQWDTTAFGKYKVRSGVYFILATTEDGLETKVGKIMIVR